MSDLTGCTASRFGNHDYRQPPHHTAEDPLVSPDEPPGECQLQSASGPPWCAHSQDYELVIYQPGTHEWIKVFGCAPCTASLRRRHAAMKAQDSLLGTKGIHSIRSVIRV